MFTSPMRRLASTCALFLVLLSSCVLAAEIPYPEITPCIPDILRYGDVGMAPLAPLAEQLGITTTLNTASGAATVTLDKHTVVFQPNSNKALCDGVEISLPMATYTTPSGLLYVPVHTLITSLGGSLTLDTARNVLAITMPNRQKPLEAVVVEPSSRMGIGKDAPIALYAMNLDGSNVRRLTYDTGCWHMPLFISKSRFFLYSHNGVIVQRAADDPTEMALPRPQDADQHSSYYPCSLSDDKKLLVFSGGGESIYASYGIYTLRAGEREPQLVTREGSMPCLSPDGATIACLRQTTDAGTDNQNLFARSLYLMSVDGGNRKLIDASADHGFQPIFSPDGALLAYKRTIQAEKNRSHAIIVLYQVTGPNAGKYYDIPWEQWKENDYDLDFSADNQWILRTNFSTGLRVMKPDGTQAKRLVTYVANDPRFSPDGTQVVFSTGNMVRLASCDGKQNKLLLQGAIVIDLAFTPNGKQILFMAEPFNPDKIIRPEKW